MSACPIDHKALQKHGMPGFRECRCLRSLHHGPYQVDPRGVAALVARRGAGLYSPDLGYWVVTRYEERQSVFRDTSCSRRRSHSRRSPRCRKSDGDARQVRLRNGADHGERGRARAHAAPPSADGPVHTQGTGPPRADGPPSSPVSTWTGSSTPAAPTWSTRCCGSTAHLALHFLGVPEEDMEELRSYSIAHTVNTWGRPSVEEQVAVAEAWASSGSTPAHGAREDAQGSVRPRWMPFGIRVSRSSRTSSPTRTCTR